MTKKELEIRENAVLYAYKYNDVDKAVQYVMQLYDRNKEKKLYRFRPPLQREIDAIKKAEIYLCFPRMYASKDPEDCRWIDDIETLFKYEVNIRNAEKYSPYGKIFTEEKYQEMSERMRNTPKYIDYKNRVSNMCLISCISDKNTSYMWETYTKNSEGLCLEYDFSDVLYAISGLNIRLFPIRYVKNRNQTKDIQFGPAEYAEDAPDELMRNKYILSCMTKNRLPYSKDSEWRVLCEQPEDLPLTESGKLFPFIRPSKIHLGKNIDHNPQFKSAVIDMCTESNIPLVQSLI